jgi:hypothetical protein
MAWLVDAKLNVYRKAAIMVVLSVLATKAGYVAFKGTNISIDSIMSICGM